MSHSLKRKLVIDTDGGIDDAGAIMMAVSCPDVEVVAITTVNGNTSARQAALNVLRVLKAAGKIEVPIYEGSYKSLLGTSPKSGYHGTDGLGEVPDVTAPGPQHIQPQHAVLTLIQLADQYKGELEVVCIGPLTNIALALRIDPQFGTKLSKFFVMGGNYQGVGNFTPASEFNFHIDPEAAYVVLHEMGRKIPLFCWETGLQSQLDWQTYDSIRSSQTDKNKFLRDIEKLWVTRRKAQGATNLVCCDVFAMAIVIDNSIVTSSFDRYATVETQGAYTRGAMIVNRGNNFYDQPENVTVITEINWEKVFNIMRVAVE